MTKSKNPAQSTLVICFGETESNYFRAIRSRLRLSSLTVKPINKDPNTILDTLIREGKHDSYDEIWIVADHDDYDLDQFFKKAKKYKIGTAISLPCFELWFILHFELMNTPITTKQCQQKWAKIYKNTFGKKYEKTDKIFEKLTAKQQKCAIKNAKKLFETNGLKENPSTSVFLLVEKYLPITPPTPSKFSPSSKCRDHNMSVNSG